MSSIYGSYTPIDYGNYNPVEAFQQGQAKATSNQTAQLANQGQQISNQANQFSLAQNKLNALSDLTDSIKDQPTYNAALNKINTLGIPLPANAPQQYDPNTVATWQDSLRQAQSTLAIQAKQADINSKTAEPNLTNAQAMNQRAQANLNQAQSGIYPGAYNAGSNFPMQGAPQGQSAQPTMQAPQGNAGQNNQMPNNGNNQVGNSDFLSTLPPPIANQVQALAEGRMPFPSGQALKTPYWQQMLSNVSSYDPSFDAINYNSRLKTRQDFASGQSANNIMALNTAIAHLGNLSQSVDQLNNSSFPSYNTVANFLGNQLGNSSIQKATSAFGTDALASASELAKVFRNTGMSQQEIEDWQKKINTTNSNDQNNSAINSALNLMDGRLNQLGEKYNQGLGTTKDPLQLLSPSAQAIYAKLRTKFGTASGAGSPQQNLPIANPGNNGGWSIQRVP